MSLKETLKKKFNYLISIGSDLPSSFPSSVERAKLKSWEASCLNLLDVTFGKESDYYKDLRRYFGYQNDKVHAHYGIEILKYAKNDVELSTESLKTTSNLEPLSFLEKLCTRFHLIVRQLRARHSDRSTLEVNDEYDVQDLMYALIRINFDNIRPEEWTPSYAGGSSRMDFLLKNEGIVIETKKTRKGLGSKELGDQLIIDIGRYKTYPDVKLLFCFIYDPEGRIANPEGLEEDLTRINNEIPVKILVTPKGI